METLYIEASSIECSEERREISGKIVPMGTGEIGNTNLGGVVFEAGSIEIDDPSKIKLLSQHDVKKPIGRMVTATVRPDGIYATFKLSRSTGGTDALVMAQEGLVSGLSRCRDHLICTITQRTHSSYRSQVKRSFSSY